jgi:hypothetical protein
MKNQHVKRHPCVFIFLALSFILASCNAALPTQRSPQGGAGKEHDNQAVSEANGKAGSGGPAQAQESGEQKGGIDATNAGKSSATPAADACAGETCSGFGACVVKQSAAVCECKAGYKADKLSCIPDPLQPKATGRTAADVKNEIDPQRYKGFVVKLASKEFEGRKWGQPGGLKAVEFIASQFAAAGLKPAGGITKMPVQNGFNVLGVIEGNDPTLKNNVVIVGGHHDHLGIKNGSIYPGANDNASGASAVMELAFAFAGLADQNKRTLLFVTFDGEEAGCMGAHAYAANPPYPLNKTDIMINFDMIGMKGGRSYGGRSLQLLSLSGSAMEIYGGATMEDYLALAQKAPYGGGCSSFDTEVFADAGIRTKNWFTGTPSNYHTPEDTVEQMDFDAAINVVKQSFDQIWQEAQK